MPIKEEGPDASSHEEEEEEEEEEDDQDDEADSDDEGGRIWPEPNPPEARQTFRLPVLCTHELWLHKAMALFCR